MIEENKIKLTPLKNDIVNEEIVRCPSCQSIFVLDSFCQSCDFQLKRKDKIDLYSLLENYYEKVGNLGRLFNTIEKSKFKKKFRMELKRSLVYRGKYLIDTLISNEEKDQAEMKTSFLEFKNLLQEFDRQNWSLELLKSHIMAPKIRFNKQALSNLSIFINEKEKQYSERRNLKTKNLIWSKENEIEAFGGLSTRTTKRLIYFVLLSFGLSLLLLFSATIILKY